VHELAELIAAGSEQLSGHQAHRTLRPDWRRQDRSAKACGQHGAML